MLRSILHWQNADSTKDLNDKIAYIYGPGIINSTGGLLVPVSGALSIQLQPFAAVSNDGLLVLEDATVSLAVVANRTNLVCLYVKYNVAADPTMTYSVLSQSEYDALLNKADYLVFGTITLASGATEVTNSDIDYVSRTDQDRVKRGPIRGVLGSESELPIDPQLRLGDSYIVASTGTTPSLRVWNGISWINTTDALTVFNQLTLHRANGYPDEIHLTDDQALAALGSSGSPSLINRYVTEADYRLPTVNQKDAMAGSHGAPSASNLFITQEFPISIPTLLPFISPAGGYIQIPLSDGPVYVGTYASMESSVPLFSILDLTLPQGYLNSASRPVRVTGLYTSSSLSVPIIGATMADSNGYYTGAVFLSISDTIDTGYRILYGRKTNLLGMPRDLAVGPSPNMDYVSNIVMDKLANIKGRAYSVSTPTREQNINMRSDLDNVNQYLGSVLETNIVCDDADFRNLAPIADIGTSFTRNIGINPQYTYQNTLLSSFSYARTATYGRVTYALAVDLTGVAVGDLFRDGAGNEYSVVAVSVGSYYLDIVNKFDAQIPTTINTSVGTAQDGSCRLNDNPRDLLLSELKASIYSDIIPIYAIEETKEVYQPTGNMVYAVRNRQRLEPRLALVGNWENHVGADADKFVRNNTGFGSIIFTGFISDCVLLMRRKATGPTLNVYRNNRILGSIDTKGSPLVTAGNTLVGPRWERLIVASSLDPDTLSTIQIEISVAGDFEIFGLEYSRSRSTALLESGRAFDDSILCKVDTIDASYSLPIVSSKSRGDRAIVSLTTTGYNTYLNSLPDIDENSPTFNSATGSVLSINTGAGKLSEYKVGDRVLLTYPAGTPSIRTVTAVGTTTLTVNSAPSSTTGSVSFLFRADNTAPIAEEEEIFRYDIVKSFSAYPITGFLATDTRARFAVCQDHITLITASSVQVSPAKYPGVNNLAILKAGGTLKILACVTRLDLAFVTTTATTLSVTVDGDTRSVTVGTGQLRLCLFKKARYQTHLVEITTSATDFAFYELIGYGVASPVPSNAPNLLADVRYLAGYRASGTLPNGIPWGGVFYEALTHATFAEGIGTGTNWTYLEDNSLLLGRTLRASKATSSCEFVFFGAAAEFHFYTAPNFGIINISLDGVLLTTVDSYAAVASRSSVSIDAVTLDYHTIKISLGNPRAKNPASSDFLIAPIGFYAVNKYGNLSLSPNGFDVMSNVADTRKFRGVSGENAVASLTFSQNELGHRAGEQSLSLGATTASITFSAPLTSTNYSLSLSLLSTTGSPVQIPFVITSKTRAGFSVKWSYPIPDTTYTLNYLAMGYN